MGVRPTGGGVRRGSRRASPSAQELLNSLGRQVFGDEYQGAPIAASKGEFNKITDIMVGPESMEYYNPTQYANLGENNEGQLLSQYDTLNHRQFYEVIGLDDVVPGYAGPREHEDTSPADITLIPTSSTNPQRPRTVAAGYDADEEKLTVVFRDGTFYNYYEVDENEWKAFKANRSKGAIIYRMLDFKPRGYADVSSLSKKAQQAFYRFSRGAQIHTKGAVAGQTKTTYKTIAQTARAKKATGKNPSTGGRAPKGR
ncbi:KTSC domain containing protein [uncultured Caudovirales phage]|uniref:KTSC domain containing protein n=1 Tax=uncultured Caudovirales phage TaxID=2100421 RepID=A0A6J5PAX9_9CAUD|nr:KTSC domain containing protein [uncultured Caudovirales phage]CAB4175289.1 KTSC domain containing protein [uncultured Caudovirales phage]CAB4178896.1 KTSC domain containing protein [uncultured Caudovirales phage]CAB4189057.1 KTSC domain containing protein [uncultured Caudovirales phage]CAB4193779.1 KTSC domain containing protein [uncultured Caudovirales phage]